MQITETEQIVATRLPRSYPARLAPDAPVAQHADRDRQFLFMLAGFRRSGGLSRAHDVSSWLERGDRQHGGTLESWVAHNEVIHFDWQHQNWLPMFQFDMVATAPHVAVGLVLIEFNGVFSNWEIAQWFANPNSALDGRNPAGVLGNDPSLVIDAARREKSLLGPACLSSNSGHSSNSALCGFSGHWADNKIGG